MTHPGLSSAQWREDLEAWVDPPIGWRPDPIKANDRHVHQTWISPSGNTAYGVIVMKLPWPVGPDLTLTAFLEHMRESEGRAQVSEKQKDTSLPGYRFTAAGKLYEIRVNLIVRDWRAWAVYAGTVISQPIVKDELELAAKARDDTQVRPG